MMYILQVTIYTALMYGIYIVALKNRAAHSWSRTYLLIAAGLPLFIPFIQMPGLTTSIPDNTVFAEVSAPVIVVSNKISASPAISQSAIALIIYMCMSVALLFRMLWEYRQIRRYVKLHSAEAVHGAKVLRDNSFAPGSWANYIFLPQDETNDAIINHELAHIELKHSWDIALLRLLKCVFWPNPVLYVIEKELKIVHEFQADALAGVNKELYTQTLLNKVFNTNHFSLGHTFFHKPLKRRITMLGKKASASLRIRIALIAGILTLFLVGGIIFLQGCKKEHTTNNSTSSENIAINEPVYNQVDKMPKTSYDLADYMAKNMSYPEAAKEKKIEGRVTIRFIVDKNGNVVNAEVLKSPDTLLSLAALNVVKNMPKWEPGEQNGQKVDVYMVLPIVFNMGNTNEKNNTKTQQENIPFNSQKRQGPPFRAIMDKSVSANKRQGDLTLDTYNPVYSQVDKMPECPYDYNTFIANNLKYPKEALDRKIEGRVLLRFIVDKDGSIQNQSVVKSPDPLLSAAAMDVISKMPKWIPGEKDGKKVAVFYNLPLMFKLAN